MSSSQFTLVLLDSTLPTLTLKIKVIKDWKFQEKHIEIQILFTSLANSLSFILVSCEKRGDNALNCWRCQRSVLQGVWSWCCWQRSRVLMSRNMLGLCLWELEGRLFICIWNLLPLHWFKIVLVPLSQYDLDEIKESKETHWIKESFYCLALILFHLNKH